MLLLYHAYVYLEFLILACTIYILAPGIDLTRMECKDYPKCFEKCNGLGIDLTRMECKAYCNSNSGIMGRRYRFNQNGM